MSEVPFAPFCEPCYRTLPERTLDNRTRSIAEEVQAHIEDALSDPTEAERRAAAHRQAAIDEMLAE